VKRSLLLATVSLWLATPVAAAFVDLSVFLPEVEQATKPNVMLRADGTITTTTPEKSTTDQIILLHRDSNDVYLELRQAKYKVLLLKGGAEALRHADGAKEAARCALETPVGGTEITCEDLQPFGVERYHTPRIVDQSGRQVQIALFPKESQYSLVVITFDREKKVPLKTMYYQETLNNLIKMRRDSDHVLVGQRWVPTRITMERFALRTTTTLDLTWMQNPNAPPEIFDGAFLSRPSNLKWPDQP
jgi:hypothetical protein